MNFVNSTYQAAATFSATLLPHNVHHRTTKQGVDVAPLVVAVDPWSLFTHIYKFATGRDANKFAFIQGETPMSTFRETSLTIAMYYVIIFGGRELMRNRAAFKLNKLFIVHNYFLSILSAGLLACLVQKLVPTIWKHGLFNSLCSADAWSQPLEMVYYLNYLTKYYELLDTVFLVLKKKPLTFLHTYHHGATAWLCYTQLVGQTSVSWVPIVLNLAVHVIMYWYYAQSARGVKIWWKQYITVFQITQFVLDLGFIYYTSWQYFASQYWPSIPHQGTCGNKNHAGQTTAAATGCAILSSYLVLFIMFYFSTYKKPSAKKALKKASKTEVPNMTETGEKAVEAIRSAGHAIADTITDENCAIKM